MCTATLDFGSNVLSLQGLKMQKDIKNCPLD